MSKAHSSSSTMVKVLSFILLLVFGATVFGAVVTKSDAIEENEDTSVHDEFAEDGGFEVPHLGMRKYLISKSMLL